MIITDYFLSTPDNTWDFAVQCGVTHGVIRLPDDMDFTSLSELETICDRFRSRGIIPKVLEPLPNPLHDHIKLGDELRDECIGQFIKLMENLAKVGIDTVCFNFMAHYGWTRTGTSYPERGGATVTGFELAKFEPDGFEISREKMWENYEYFIRAVVPYAEKYGIKLALHPDDPPLPELGGVGRIMISLENIKRAISVVESPNLGVTFCQACYVLMGEQLEHAISELAEKIFFVHFRNVRGTKTDFRETFHDNGEIDMRHALELYEFYCPMFDEIPIRVDHVPTYAGETEGIGGYAALGRLFAIGYLKGLLE